MRSLLRRLIKEEGGEQVLQTVLLSGLLLVITVTLFFPQIQVFFSQMMTTITDWFMDEGSAPFN